MYRDAFETRHASSAPAAFSRDDLICPEVRTHEDRLNDAVSLDRFGKRDKLRFSDRFSRLQRIGRKRAPCKLLRGGFVFRRERGCFFDCGLGFRLICWDQRCEALS